MTKFIFKVINNSSGLINGDHIRDGVWIFLNFISIIFFKVSKMVSPQSNPQMVWKFLGKMFQKIQQLLNSRIKWNGALITSKIWAYPKDCLSSKNFVVCSQPLYFLTSAKGNRTSEREAVGSGGRKASEASQTKNTGPTPYLLKSTVSRWRLALAILPAHSTMD